MLHVTPLFAGSPMALPVSATVPPASTWLTAEEMDTMMFGGGGVAPPLLQPAMTVRQSKPANRRVRTSKLFTGPPQRSGIGTPGNFPIFPWMNCTGLRKAAETILGVVYLSGIYVPGISAVALRCLRVYTFCLQSSPCSDRTGNFGPSENAITPGSPAIRKLRFFWCQLPGGP
jgi:hypothetical protein